ncbi:MAG: heavy-metal-associated domain-containing protein [Eubacteriaceae bacterium]|nr:heavy-metal-associated domain-containing protein [Eubacteriaceae bacterium]
MKRSYKLENLCCANCAAKIERELNRLPGIDSATIAFMAQRLNLEAEDMDTAVASAQKVVSKIEKDCVIKV